MHLDAAVKHKVKDRFVNFSTSEVLVACRLSRQKTVQTKVGSAGEARWTYAVSKLAAEHLVHAYHKNGLPIVTQGLLMYMERVRRVKSHADFYQKAINDDDIYIYGDGSQNPLWCYVNDFIEGLIQCIDNKMQWTIF